MTRVKICGVRTPEHALVAAEAGADFVGLVFYPPSKRYVSPQDAVAVAAAARRGGAAVVGLFANQPLTDICDVARLCPLDFVQLSGDEPPAFCAAVRAATGLVVIKAIRPADGALDPAALYPESIAPILLVDAPSGAGAWGGTGRSWDYAAAAVLGRERPILLAGGLSTANVAAAIRTAQPWGVDVSSGVETDGVKDPAKIVAFVRAARAAGEPVAGARTLPYAEQARGHATRSS